MTRFIFTKNFPIGKKWCVYMLRGNSNVKGKIRYYIGSTNNFLRRYSEHSAKKSGFGKRHKNIIPVGTILCRSEKEARSLEYKLKKLNTFKRKEMDKRLIVERNLDIHVPMG